MFEIFTQHYGVVTLLLLIVAAYYWYSQHLYNVVQDLRRELTEAERSATDAQWDCRAADNKAERVRRQLCNIKADIVLCLQTLQVAQAGDLCGETREAMAKVHTRLAELLLLDEYGTRVKHIVDISVEHNSAKQKEIEV